MNMTLGPGITTITAAVMQKLSNRRVSRSELMTTTMRSDRGLAHQ